MTIEKTEVIALIPPNEARDLVLRATKLGVSSPEYLGYLILFAAYGIEHTEAAEFLMRAGSGQVGTQE